MRKETLNIGGHTGVLVLAVILLSSCVKAGDQNFLEDFTVFPGAQGIERIRFEHANAEQLLFRVNKPFPAKDVTQFYTDQFTRRGWTPCNVAMRQWDSYEDYTISKGTFVHELKQYWVKVAPQKLSIFAARYYSHGRQSEKPDNNDLTVIIWVQRTQDLNAEVERLRLSCG